MKQKKLNSSRQTSSFERSKNHLRRSRCIQNGQVTTLGARDFSSAVSVFCQVFIVTRSWLRPTAEDVSAFGQNRKFPPHARKTSGTQGTKLHTKNRKKLPLGIMGRLHNPSLYFTKL